MDSRHVVALYKSCKTIDRRNIEDIGIDLEPPQVCYNVGICGCYLVPRAGGILRHIYPYWGAMLTTVHPRDFGQSEEGNPEAKDAYPSCTFPGKQLHHVKDVVLIRFSGGLEGVRLGRVAGFVSSKVRSPMT